MSQSSKTEVSFSESPHASLPEHVNGSRNNDLDSQPTGNGQTATMSSSPCQTIASSPTVQNQGDITSSVQPIQPAQDSNSSARRRKQHTCKHCSKTVSHLGHLKEHERIHTGEKPYHCKQCGKGFGRSYLLVRHERLHTGEKPFQCKVCEKNFVQLSSLKAHQSLHTGEKPYRCERCDKRFAQLSNLKAHQRVHTGEKPFVCTQCDKGFTRQDYLAGHQRLLHAGKDLTTAVNGSVPRVSVSESFLPCTPPERSSSILNVVTVS